MIIEALGSPAVGYIWESIVGVIVIFGVHDAAVALHLKRTSDVETKLHYDCRTGVYFNHPHADAAAGVWGVDQSLLISHSVQLSSCLSHFCLCSGPTVTHCNLTLQGPLPTLPSFVPGRCSGLPSQGRVGRGALNTDLSSEETQGSIITPILSSLVLQACLDSVPGGGTNFIWEIASCKTN